ncbi:hypothetical protein NHX12_025134 [Muraenolepis orangiensis]|uniref:G protein-regulated inducer of neurite outgrowth C-terminal domain-containing protein n=1 Tax=Muraenolepis orangiensis TaxID=630683 RepID=A0A9Q0EJK7_9TELE|nr:hypothetical protein NHX12_025134 [Muraenolepis orangiensis]
MAERWRPAFRSGLIRVTASHEAWMEAEEEEEEEEEEEYEEAEDGPIFSLSKSLVDVFMATGPLHPLDPASTRQGIRRCSSANTHLESCSLQQPDDGAASTYKALLIPNRSPRHDPPPLSKRRIANTEGLSARSTPDGVVWSGGAVPTWSLVQEAPSPKLASPASPPPPFVSPTRTPPWSSPESQPSPPTLHQQTLWPPPAPATPEVCATSPAMAFPWPPAPPELRQLSRMEKGRIPANHCSPSPSPLLSHHSISPGREAGVGTASRPQAQPIVEGVPGVLPGVSGSTLSMGGGEGDDHMMSTQPSAPRREARGTQPGSSSSSDLCVNRGWKSPLVSSLSASGLSMYCRCNSAHSRPGIPASAAGGKEYARDEVKELRGTPRPPARSVDAAVQTASPSGSGWNLRRHMSYVSTSHMGSHSMLGSPPGSRLNLHSPLGSNSNLVSPSSSMFLEESRDEDEEENEEEKEGGEAEEEEQRGEDSSLVWEISTPPVLPVGRRRSCLKVQGDVKFRLRDELGRRSSMKQVQWDEEGMTWDVYGSSIDSEELSVAIQRHLNLQVGRQDRQSPWSPKRNPMEKKTKGAGAEKNQTRAPKDTALDPKGQAAVAAAAAAAEVKAKSDLEKGCGKKLEMAEGVCRKGKFEAKREQGASAGEEEGVHQEGTPESSQGGEVSE